MQHVKTFASFKIEIASQFCCSSKVSKLLYANFKGFFLGTNLHLFQHRLYVVQPWSQIKIQIFYN